MTETHNKIITYITTYQADNPDKSPSYEEIGAAVGLKSKQLVAYHLQKMESAGLVARVPGKYRGLRVIS